MPRLPHLFLPLLFISLPACSSFEKDWTSPPLKTSQRQSPLAGKWTGTWQSNANHGKGELRAILLPNPADDNLCDASFKFTHWSLFAPTLDVQFTSHTEADGRVTFHGAKYLGPFAGGTYTYDGDVTQNTLHCAYSSKSDRGSFDLTRIAEATTPTTQPSTRPHHPPATQPKNAPAW